MIAPRHRLPPAASGTGDCDGLSPTVRRLVQATNGFLLGVIVLGFAVALAALVLRGLFGLEHGGR